MLSITLHSSPILSISSALHFISNACIHWQICAIRTGDAQLALIVAFSRVYTEPSSSFSHTRRVRCASCCNLSATCTTCSGSSSPLICFGTYFSDLSPRPSFSSVPAPHCNTFGEIVVSRYYHAGLTFSDGFSDQLPGTVQ